MKLIFALPSLWLWCSIFEDRPQAQPTRVLCTTLISSLSAAISSFFLPIYALQTVFLVSQDFSGMGDLDPLNCWQEASVWWFSWSMCFGSVAGPTTSKGTGWSSSREYLPWWCRLGLHRSAVDRGVEGGFHFGIFRLWACQEALTCSLRQTRYRDNCWLLGVQLYHSGCCWRPFPDTWMACLSFWYLPKRNWTGKLLYIIMYRSFSKN